MKKVLFATILLVVFLAPSLVAADALTLKQILGNIYFEIIIPIFYSLAVICMIVSGIMFLTAAGDPEKLGKAKKAFMWGVIGIAIGLVSSSVYTILQAILGGPAVPAM